MPSASPEKRDSRVIVLGMGNLLLQDEGVGIHVVRALQESPALPKDGLEVIDGGTSPDVLLGLSGRKLIIVDAVKGGGEPGSVYRFTPEQIAVEGKMATSLHQLGLMDALILREQLRDRPQEVVIIGVEPGVIDWGLELSPAVREKLPRIVEVMLEEIGA